VKVARSITASGYGYFKKESAWPNSHGGFRHRTRRTNRRWAFARLTNANYENRPCILVHLLFSLRLPLSGLRIFRLPLEWHTLRQLIIISLRTANRQRGAPIYIFFPISLLLSFISPNKYLKDVFQEYSEDTENIIVTIYTFLLEFCVI